MTFLKFIKECVNKSNISHIYYLINYITSNSKYTKNYDFHYIFLLLHINHDIYNSDPH